MSLNSGQRKYLRGLAHHLEPLVLVGKKGMTDSFVRSVADALDAHELVKVRFNEFKEEKKEILEELTRRTGADLVGLVGHVATIYKWQADDEKRIIVLPQ